MTENNTTDPTTPDPSERTNGVPDALELLLGRARAGDPSVRAAPPPEGKKKKKKKDKGPKRSAADEAVDLAAELYDYGQTTAGETFAVKRDGANLARLIGGPRGLLRAELAAEYRDRYGRVCSGSGLTDAIKTIEGYAMRKTPQSLALRVGSYGDGIAYDLGTPDGAAVVCNADGWEIVPRSPILFMRTRNVGPMPMPVPGGSLSLLTDLLNVSEPQKPLIEAWLLHALTPRVVKLIMVIRGPQGLAKTSIASFIAGSIDEHALPLNEDGIMRGPPRSSEDWNVAAGGCYVNAIDNVSSQDMRPWFVEDLCRTSTGNSHSARARFTDGDTHDVAFKRPVIMTGIEFGNLKDDLGSRILWIEPLAGLRSRLDVALMGEFMARRPLILGAIFSEMVRRRWAEVEMGELGRMGGYEIYLAAKDALDGTKSLELYPCVISQDAGFVAQKPISRGLIDLARLPLAGLNCAKEATAPPVRIDRLVQEESCRVA